MSRAANVRMALLAVMVFILDQASKFWVLSALPLNDEHPLVPGFFKLVHWENSGAAWSLFRGRNEILAVVSIAALIGLFIWRRHFYVHLPLGCFSLGLIFGGIAGNLFDRLHYHHEVIDFLRFYLDRRNGQEIGFPAFNIADSAICIGVGLLILVSWKNEPVPETTASPRGQPAAEGFRAEH